MRLSVCSSTCAAANAATTARASAVVTGPGRVHDTRQQIALDGESQVFRRCAAYAQRPAQRGQRALPGQDGFIVRQYVAPAAGERVPHQRGKGPLGDRLRIACRLLPADGQGEGGGQAQDQQHAYKAFYLHRSTSFLFRSFWSVISLSAH